MTAFLILAAALVAGALLLVVPPLLGRSERQAQVHADHQRQAATALVVLREQLADLESERAAGNISDEEYARSRDELEQRALEEGQAADTLVDLRPSRRWAALAGLGVPVLAVGTYLWLGEPAGLDPVQTAAPEGGHELTPEQIAGMVAQLAQRLEREPDNAEGWLMLARSYMMLQDFQNATAFYGRMKEKMPADADVLADWADLLAGAQGRKVSGESERLIERALAVNPDHVKALALAGTAAFQRQDYAAASGHWERILRQVPPGEELARSILASINEARAKGGMPLLQAAAAGAAPSAPKAPAAATGEAAGVLSASGRVSLSPEVASRAAADDTVFVFARPAQGGMPLAALRYRVADLPVTFNFEDAQRMSDGPLPAQLTIAARVSKQGDATPRAGDLEGRSAPVAPDATAVDIVIDRVRE